MVYIAFLQGINVGKHNRIQMNDLKHLFETMGLKNVQTYLQSGNVIFESDKDEIYLRKMIEREIFIIHKYVVPVVIRTSSDLKQIIKNCPFSKDRRKEAELATGESVYIALLKQVPTLEKILNIDKYKDDEDEYQIVGREVYLLLLKNNFRNSNLARNLNKLDIHATIRSWNTIKKLINLINKADNTNGEKN